MNARIGPATELVPEFSSASASFAASLALFLFRRFWGQSEQLIGGWHIQQPTLAPSVSSASTLRARFREDLPDDVPVPGAACT